MSFYTPFWLIGLGFLPSIVWLSFYLKKDIHPEPRYLILRVFFMGIIIAPLAVFAQWILSKIGISISPDFSISESAIFFLFAAFVEEWVKFLAVWTAIISSPEFDEPVDAMIYMVAAALGFAAIENTLVLFQTEIEQGTSAAIQVLGLRFVGATLLHALSSALAGYFLALSWFYYRHSKKLITLGITIATLFHAIFNIIISKLKDNPEAILYLLALLILMASLISMLFSRIKKRSGAQ